MPLSSWISEQRLGLLVPCDQMPAGHEEHSAAVVRHPPELVAWAGPSAFEAIALRAVRPDRQQRGGVADPLVEIREPVRVVRRQALAGGEDHGRAVCADHGVVDVPPTVPALRPDRHACDRGVAADVGVDGVVGVVRGELLRGEDHHVTAVGRRVVVARGGSEPRRDGRIAAGRPGGQALSGPLVRERRLWQRTTTHQQSDDDYQRFSQPAPSQSQVKRRRDSM